MEYEKEIARLTKAEKRLQLLGDDDPRCGLCGYNKNSRNVEKHHVAGRKNSKLTVPLCRNCHGDVSDRQEEQAPDFRSNESNDPLVRQAAMLQGVALLLIVLAVALMAWSEWNYRASADLATAYGAEWYTVIAADAPQ
jgi:hypothetical protein